jgi:cytoskeleton protein RodZ
VPAAGAPGQRELRITAAEETWLAIGVDDQPVRSTLLKPGDSRTWTAQAAFTLTVGNAGGITVALDGQELPRLGGSGQVVRNLRLPRTDAPPSG